MHRADKIGEIILRLRLQIYALLFKLTALRFF